MYIAELKGKLSSRVERSEDILTSNVFSFFKYSDRTIFLKQLLNKIGLNLSDKDLKVAEFLFWPRYDDNTEPDLVIIVGNYYILIESKYFSGFGEETSNKKSQLSREIEEGMMDAKVYGKQFMLVTITADYFFNPQKFEEINSFPHIRFKWINWQIISSILVEYLGKLDKQESYYLFVSDLYDLLEKKNLRTFISFKCIKYNSVQSVRDRVFFKGETSKYRGKFIGFNKSLINVKIVGYYNKRVLFSKTYFRELQGKNLNIDGEIFLKEIKE